MSEEKNEDNLNVCASKRLISRPIGSHHIARAEAYLVNRPIILSQLAVVNLAVAYPFNTILYDSAVAGDIIPCQRAAVRMDPAISTSFVGNVVGVLSVKGQAT